MTARTPTRPPTTMGARAGFTLLELLTVILIIAILIAVAFPAYNAVMRNTRIATARAEIASLEGAIAEFKAEFNVEPPSYISFVPGSGGLPPATKAILRQMFPQISFDAALQTSLTQAGLWDRELGGSECLVFFLGGVRRTDGTGYTNELVGFSKNPANPFAQPTAGQQNRLGPFFEFDSGRLGEITRATAAPLVIQAFNTDPAAFTGNPLAYADSLPGQTVPLLYVSTAGTGVYNASHVPELASGPFAKSATTYWNPNSYQLISPGFDGKYGAGGLYKQDDGSSPAVQAGGGDNLTNFTNGALEG